MSESANSTPRPVTEGSTHIPKYYAPKDKKCPFCGQVFTSSSLGRHLDLYIRPKNPKAPDGVHNVDEIRKLRGGVTRRNMGSSSTRKGDSTPAVNSKEAEPSGDDGSPVALDSPCLNTIPNEKVRARFNELNWQTTGVVSNLPSRPTINTGAERRRDVSRHIQQKTDFEQRQKLSDEWENGKAAELALKEILQNIRDASTRAAGSTLFDFDFYSTTFPGLCLRILPAPSSLFSVAPFSANDSWPLGPPNQKHYDALQKHVFKIIQQRQRQHSQAGHATPHSASSATPASPLTTSPPLENTQRLLSHLTDAYSHWKSLSEKERQQAWQHEILRSYHRASESRKEMERKLEAAEQEIAQLKSRPWTRMGIDAAAYTQLALKHYSALPSVTAENVREMAKKGVDLRAWDYDRVVEKWRTVVRENRKVSNGLVAQRSLSTSSVPKYNGGPTPASSLQVSPTTGPGSMNVSGANSIAQSSSSGVPALSTAATSDSVMDDEDDSGHLDGEGEDDEDAEGDVDTEQMQREHIVQQQRAPPPQMNHHQQQMHTNHVTHQPPQQVFWDHGSLSRRGSHQSLGSHQGMVHHHSQMMHGQPSPLSMMPMDGIEAHANNFMHRQMAANVNTQSLLSAYTGMPDGSNGG